MAIMVEKISAVTFRVSNMKASVQFYRDVLGMEVLYGGEGAFFSSLRAGEEDCASASKDITSASAKQINISFFIRELLSEGTTLGGTPLMCGSCVPLRPRVTPKTWFSG